MKVVVLNDGETFTALDGCTVLDVPDNIEDDDVDEYVKEFAHAGFRMEDVMRGFEKSIR